MQLNMNGYEALRWTVALMALTILLGGCESGHGQQADRLRSRKWPR